MKITSIIYQTAIGLYRYVPFKKLICVLIRCMPGNKEFLYRDLTFYGRFKCDLDHKTLWLMHYHSTVENEIFWKGLDKGWECVSLKIWFKASRYSEIIMDVGANSGIYSLVAALENENAKVYSFEPSRSVAEKFRKNIVLNKFRNIIVEEVALSNTNGEVIFYDFDGGHQYSASLNKNMVPEEATKIEVPVVAKTLSSYIDENRIPKIDLIKIDVEMHEPEVLEGMGPYISRFKPTIIIEILSDDIGLQVETLTRNMGYLYFNIDEVNPPQLMEHITKSGKYNYLLCQEEMARLLSLIQ